MKRHESLAPLSREHHEALILARLLQKNAPAYKSLPSATDDKIAYAVRMYHEHLHEHFIKEEAVLDKVKSIHPEIDKLAAEILTEHKMLTMSFLALTTGEDKVETMHALGTALEKHIRKEERILFPLIQEHCSAELSRLVL